MKQAPPERRAPWLRPAVLVPIGILVLVGIGYGVMRIVAAGETADARSKLLADVEASANKIPRDSDELQRLMTMLKKLPDHDQAHDALAAKARILLARDQPEAAQGVFGSIALSPTATPGEQGLGARILLRVHESGVVDGAGAAGILEQVMQLAAASYRESHSPGDLLRAWQAAERAGQHERAAEFRKQLKENHAESGENRFVEYALGFDPARPVADLDDVLADCLPAPAESAAMRVWAQLQANQLGDAVKTAEEGLARAPGVGVVRWAAAVAFHACVVAPSAAPEHERWVLRRDEQLDWVRRQPGEDEGRKKQASAMRDVR